MTPTNARPAVWLPRSAFTRVLTLVIGSGAVVTVVSLLLAGARASAAPSLWRLALATGLMAVSELAVVHLRFGRDNYTITWSEAAIGIGLVLVPWPWMPAVAAIGVAMAMVAARRAPEKTAFNASSAAVAAALACFAVALTGGSPSTDTGVRLCVDLAVGAIVYFVWNTATVTAVIAAVRGVPPGEVLRSGMTLKLVALLGNTVIALVLVNLEWRGSAFVLVSFTLVLLYLAYVSYHRALRDGEVWRELDAAIRDFMTLDASGTAAAAAAHAVRLFEADRAEVVLVQESGRSARVYRHLSTGESSTANEAFPQPEQDGVVEISLGAANAADDPPVLDVLRIRPLSSRPMPERRLQALRTFAHAVGSSLQNARLFAETRYQAELSAREAASDPLTGIPNRRVLYTETSAELSRAGHEGGGVALLLIDLDNFKDINDTLGHHAGDLVLCRVAERLTFLLGSRALVARLGGDEFGILVPDSANLDADELAGRLLGVIAIPIPYEELQIAVAASIGIAHFPADATTAEELFRCADIAMYQAKHKRGSFATYSSDYDAKSVSRIVLAAELRTAVHEKQFIVQFQPQVSLHDGSIIGTEALARWIHPVRGPLGPAEFIDEIERSDLIRQFTRNVLRMATSEAAAWNRDGYRIPVSVNLSARNLMDADLPRDVADALEASGLEPAQLILEITETVMIVEAAQAEDVLAQLRALGVGLSVDDFGTGYSSLTFLQRVAVNEIKVDRSFVGSMLQSDNDAAIVRATVELAHGLGIRVVAEGVETAEQVVALRELGCDIAQGWHYGRPMSPEQLRALVGRARGPHRPSGEPRSLSRLACPAAQTPVVG